MFSNKEVDSEARPCNKRHIFLLILSAPYFKGWKIVSAVLLNGEICEPRELLPSPSTRPEFWPFWLNCTHFDIKDIFPLHKLGFECHSNPLNVSPYFVKKEKEWLIPKQSCVSVIYFFALLRLLLHLCLQQPSQTSIIPQCVCKMLSISLLKQPTVLKDVVRAKCCLMALFIDTHVGVPCGVKNRKGHAGNLISKFSLSWNWVDNLESCNGQLYKTRAKTITYHYNLVVKIYYF